MGISLGKITNAQIRFDGRDDHTLSLCFSFDTPSYSICARPEPFTAQTGRLLSKILDDAKKTELGQLVGVPVELTYNEDHHNIESWRVLTEVL